MKQLRSIHWVIGVWFLWPAMALASGSVASGTNAMPAQATATVEVEVKVDARVELVSELCRLAGYDEYEQALMPNYAKSVDAYFKRYANLPAVRTLKRLRKTAGLGYDGPMALALLLPKSTAETPKVSITALRNNAITIDVTDARAFLAAAQRFRRDTKADNFFATQRSLYGQIERSYRKQIVNHIDLAWFLRMFGSPVGQHQQRFVVVPALLNGPSMYGKHVQLQDGGTAIYAILGVARNKQRGGFWHDRSLGLLVHELLHSYMNPWVDAHAARLRPLMQPLYASVVDQMQKEAYDGWRTMTYETMVRGGVLAYFSDHHAAKGRAGALRQDKEQGFVWIERVAAALAPKPGEQQPWIKANKAAVFKVLAALGQNPHAAEVKPNE